MPLGRQFSLQQSASLEHGRSISTQQGVQVGPSSQS
jgi:hypothetical protein